MATPYSRISPLELDQFLTDVHKNFEHDVEQNALTDFKKLALCLFRFASAKLLTLKDRQDAEAQIFVTRIFSATELVFSKRKSLLNIEILPSELALIYTDAPTSLTRPHSPILFYEWSITFAVSWLSQFPENLDLTNSIKLFLIEVINIVTVHLHGLKHKKNLRTKLLKTLDANVDKLYRHVSSEGNNELHPLAFGALLSTTTHLFTVLNDYDISAKLILHTANYKHLFESYAKKLEFSMSASSTTYLDLLLQESGSNYLDTSKSVLLLNLTSNVILDKAVRWSLVELILRWIHLHFGRTQQSQTGFLQLWLRYNRATCMSLLRIFLFCRNNNALPSFFNSFPLSQFDLNPNTHLAQVSPIISKALHLLHYQSLLLTDSTAARSMSIAAPFMDVELDDLRAQVLQINPLSMFKQLSFIVDKTNSYSVFIASKDSAAASEGPGIKSWLMYIIKLFQQNPSSPGGSVFDDLMTFYSFITVLRDVPCMVAGDFDITSGKCMHCTTLSGRNLYESISVKRKQVVEVREAMLLYSAVLCDHMLKSYHERLFENKLLATNFLLALFNLFATYRLPDRDCTIQNPCIEFVLRCLVNHDNRDVRILAARVLPLFFIREVDQSVEDLFKEIFGTLSRIKFSSSRQNVHLAESTMLALAELAVISEGEWLCVILIKMMQLLNVSNEQHVNLAYSSILYIGYAKSMTPYKLLSPFLPSIAEIIIKESRMFSKITELLGVSKRYFLSNTREYTTPLLLEYYKYDFVQDIADALNMNKAKLITKMLPRIIAIYFCKDDKIDAKYIVSVLRNASPNYRSVTIDELVSNPGAILWFILLRMQVAEDGSLENEANITRAIEFIAKISLSKRSEKNSLESLLDLFDYVSYMLQEHVLELAQKFSEIIHQINGIKPFVEKISSIKAIQFLITRDIDAATWALGQISTCLQAAMDYSYLEVHALLCWNALVQGLDSPKLVSLFDITISLIFQKFDSFSVRAKTIAAEILKRLYREITEKYNNYGAYYYSYSFAKDLDKFYVADASAQAMLKLKNKVKLFPELTRRLETNNRIVVHQALDDLINLSKVYQQKWQVETLRDNSSAGDISRMVRTILDLSVQFKHKDASLATKCATVLASLGALDSSKFNFKAIKSQIIILHDFQDYLENARFLVDFIQNRVIKNFWASNDPMRQLFSVYSMQSFLTVLGLESSIVEGESQGVRGGVWNSFSEINRSTLTPLLSSRYFASPPRYEPIEFPHFRLGMKFEKWLVDLTTELVRRPLAATSTQKNKAASNSTKTIIFQTCSMLIRDEEISISLYLLRYVVLSHIVSGDDQVRNDILTEFLSVLNTDATFGAGSERTENLKLCYQSIFEVLDYFNEWVSAATQRMSEAILPKVDLLMLKNCRLQVLRFLEEIPTELIAFTSSQCDSYERTILYLEKCYRNEKGEVRETLDKLNIAGTLQLVYSNIEDYDALNGVLRKFSTNNLAEKLDAFQYNEDWYIAQESFQVLSNIGSEDARIECNTRLLKSFANHALYEKVLLSLDSQAGNSSVTSLPMDWAMVGLQAALESGEFDEISRWYNATRTIGRPQDVEDIVTLKYAESITFLAHQEHDKFNQAISEIYSIVGRSLSLSVSSSFSRNTKLMRQLHVMFDSSLIVSSGMSNALVLPDDLMLTLKERMKNTDLEFNTQWRLLSMHKLCFKATDNDDKISTIYLASSNIARRDKRLDIATKSIVKAMSLNDREASVEYAHLLWEQGKQTEAIKTMSENLDFGDSKMRAKRQLQYALWLDESSHSSSATIIEEYTKAYRLDNKWDKPFFDLGKYYSKIMESQNDRSGVYEKHIIRFYLHALKLGTTYIFEALPKLITIWLDFAQRPPKTKDAAKRLNSLVSDLAQQKDDIPMYVWFTSITQLFSRLTHSHEPSVKVMMQIIASLISTYPRHSLWYTLSHVRSKDKVRRERVTNILNSLGTNQALGENIRNAKILFDILVKLAEYKIPSGLDFSKKRWLLSDDFGVQDTKKRYTSLVIPVKSNLEIRIPAANAPHSTSGSRLAWHAFPKSASVTFDGFDDLVHVFQSLQKPKQITIRGSDNQPYRLMVKKDDTRKDAKVFEFTNMINRLLTANTEARKRKLVVENYSVIPLAEDMGVIEFVQNVSTMKSVISAQQKKAGIIVDEKRIFRKISEAQKVAKARCSTEPGVDNSLIEFFRSLCSEVKPVLHQWFIDQFSDPAMWYAARTCFTRTSAVMSIVGYIIGLGDRHCENILFVKKNGAALHIDFDCLFDKGIDLPTPEVVPFRLTQNLVDAMGITGIEGTFRVTCEVAGTLVRANEASLMNILETLIYDPLLDWKTLEKPQEHLKKVRRKIRGLLDTEGLPMNVHGQVDYLIQQASSDQNLSAMYGGWAAYI